jgi:hypothetical protein
MIYLNIQPITFGELKEKKANAIAWQVNGLVRGAQIANADCGLVWLNNDGSTIESGWTFSIPIDNATLQAWGADDSVIDNVVLAYSPLFVKV